MYSPYLQEYIKNIGAAAEIPIQSIGFLEESLACFVGALGRALNASTQPEADLLQVTIRLLLLDDGLAKLADDNEYNGIHYLVGLGFEQTGELLSRLHFDSTDDALSPLESDNWYGLCLALLHYLAGGHRVQAFSVLRHLDRIQRERRQGAFGEEYRFAYQYLRQLHSGITPKTLEATPASSSWGQLIFGENEITDAVQLRIARLARKIRRRRDIVLDDLGLNHESEWLAQRNISESSAIDFWARYLQRLDERGINTFTTEQKGPDPGFDGWLRTDKNLLVILPTGSGKTIIGELRSALTLAQGRQVIWVLPTRSLVRQTQREMRRAFEALDVNVEELPTTEDFLAVNADIPITDRYLAATTPEKLSALMRANPESVSSVGLVVVDEAQILTREDRGTTVEFVLQQIRAQAPNCQFVLMSGFEDARVLLERFLTHIKEKPFELYSAVRPTRRVYGILTAEKKDKQTHPYVLLYPPGIQTENGKTEKAFRLTLDKTRVPINATPTTLAERFSSAVTSSGVRSVIFVQNKQSTESKSKTIARKNKNIQSLSRRDTTRLEIELGRESAIVSPGQHEVAPHHAGLTPLELHMVEKWVYQGTVKTVVATPTLAQGVNLPFDLSIVTFTNRRNQKLNKQEQLPYSEILNMLGRAGRAGYVSDGVCLLARKRDLTKSAIKQLDSSRRFFFHPIETTDNKLGLSRLIALATRANIDAPNWLLSLDGAPLGDVQSLVTFVLEVGANEPQPSVALLARLQEFPSLQEMEETELTQIVARFERLVQNIKEICATNPSLIVALQRTGLPVEVLAQFFTSLGANSEIFHAEPSKQILWTDQTVKTALIHCQERNWAKDLLKGIDIELLLGLTQGSL